jgi:Glyoxalase-like domain
MAIARFKKLCVDATDPAALGTFWAAALRQEYRPWPHGEGGVFGTSAQPTLWLNRVPEPKTVKHRVHLDIYTESLAALEELGARVLVPEGDDRRWTVLADPEDGEFCAFVRAVPPEPRLHGIGIDCVNPAAQARWWGYVFGRDVVDDPSGFSTVEHVVAENPVLTLDFAAVPEPKTVKNRVHWDVSVPDVAALVDAGATVLGQQEAWYVLADPEGNEFCAFVE